MIDDEALELQELEQRVIEDSYLMKALSLKIP